MLPFILVSGLLLALFCWRELLKGALLPLVLGMVIGAFPLIYYNLHGAPKTDILTVMSLLYNAGRTGLAQMSAHDQLPFEPELGGTLLTGLPAATGGIPFCYDSKLMLTGYLSTQQLQCSIAHGDWRLITLALAWSLGYILLWTVAVFLTLRSLWRLRIRTSGNPWSSAEKQAIVRNFARLMLLFSAGFILLLFILSPVSAAFSGYSRYLIGLLVSTPALIAPLWGLSDDERAMSAGVSTRDNYCHARRWLPITLNFGTFKVALRRGLLLLIGIVLLVGTINAFLEISTVQSYRQQDALMHDLLRIKATHIYTDYWTCDSIAFLSREQIICGVLDDHLQPSHNRYSPYYYIVKADPLTSYVFFVGSAQVATLEKQATFSNGSYRRFVFDGFVIYQPVSTVK